MSQTSEINSPQPSQPELKPQLKAVLGYLDVQLESELTRYRRHRRRNKQTTPDPNGQTNPQFKLGVGLSVGVGCSLFVASSMTPITG